MGQAADFFVSYTNADRAWAEWIAWQLETDGYQVVFQGWDFMAGSDWAHGMQRATTGSSRRRPRSRVGGDQYAIMGAAWGAPIRRVEVRIDDGPWMRARLKRHQPQKRKSAEFAWTFWKLDWGTPASGPHTVTDRLCGRMAAS
jgi:TIR domain/Mo-co oxidoreductase dimerisation domain